LIGWVGSSLSAIARQHVCPTGVAHICCYKEDYGSRTHKTISRSVIVVTKVRILRFDRGDPFEKVTLAECQQAALLESHRRDTGIFPLPRAGEIGVTFNPTRNGAALWAHQY
jgi:hypothetical protein